MSDICSHSDWDTLLLKHLGAETSHPYSDLPKSLICKIVSIVNGCLMLLSFEVVCYATIEI